jgi:hypothetical protein
LCVNGLFQPYKYLTDEVQFDIDNVTTSNSKARINFYEGRGEMKKITPTRLREMKERGEKITLLCVYDYPLAKVLDECGVRRFLLVIH